ncbi:hypothetical protein ASPTUDRAFT_839624 [Aspergillus tubingensis CBS 134.48]|uniref:Transmembrane protein n=1 Tax=Aspergillus tubingensis (strain CBS 134.48) TaxID=767770 RepID=A0A1L9MST5_ASPTC|nr:hypothetical protein ASPTUDRAFT_839624 [Aspergillus tubingensis CBS 134.48]
MITFADVTREAALDCKSRRLYAQPEFSEARLVSPGLVASAGNEMGRGYCLILRHCHSRRPLRHDTRSRSSLRSSQCRRQIFDSVDKHDEKQFPPGRNVHTLAPRLQSQTQFCQGLSLLPAMIMKLCRGALCHQRRSQEGGKGPRLPCVVTNCFFFHFPSRVPTHSYSLLTSTFLTSLLFCGVPAVGFVF